MEIMQIILTINNINIIMKFYKVKVETEYFDATYKIVYFISIFDYFYTFISISIIIIYFYYKLYFYF